MIASIVVSSSPPLFLRSALPTLRISGLREKRKIPKPGVRRRGCSTICKAELVHDAPFAAAMGACVLTSIIFPVTSDGDEDEESGGAIDSTDARLAVMGIISFIPYFNWLSWVFAWMDSGLQRYLVYSIVYLAPYLRTNLSLSPEESWLPIASIFVCVLHIQLEASIRSGDFKDINILEEVLKILSPMSRQKDLELQSHKGKCKRHMVLPSEEGSREKIRDWGIPRKPVDELEQLNEDLDVDARDRSD